MKLLLSYPQSGNHLVRFLIEILTETPTLSLCGNRRDIPIFKNVFPESIPFNITSVEDYDNNNLYAKKHRPPTVNPDELIFIVRNPREVLIRHCGEKMTLNGWGGYKNYFKTFFSKLNVLCPCTKLVLNSNWSSIFINCKPCFISDS